MQSIPAAAGLSDPPLTMLPPDSRAMFPGEGQSQKSRPLNPRASLEDYNRVMLEYTRRRMSTFVDIDNGRHGSTSSESSRSSENSSPSTSSVLARKTGPTVPTSSNGAKPSKEALST